MQSKEFACFMDDGVLFHSVMTIVAISDKRPNSANFGTMSTYPLNVPVLSVNRSIRIGVKKHEMQPILGHSAPSLCVFLGAMLNTPANSESHVRAVLPLFSTLK